MWKNSRVFSDPTFSACATSLFPSPQSKCLITPGSALGVTPSQVLLGFSDTLGRVLLMGAQVNEVKAPLLTDTAQNHARGGDAKRGYPGRSGRGRPLSVRCSLPL